MKIRTVALGGLAALALGGPALASDAGGWYVDVSAGWDGMGTLNLQGVSPGGTATDASIAPHDSGLFTGALGYRFDRIRIEGEVGWDDHNINVALNPPASGHADVTSFLANAAYDLPLAQQWGLSFGGGIGYGTASIDITQVTPGTTETCACDWVLPGGSGPPVFTTPSATVFIRGTPGGLMVQGFAGFYYSLGYNLDLALDYRYRSVMLNGTLSNDFDDVVHVKNVDEQTVMVGMRWYPWASPP